MEVNTIAATSRSELGKRQVARIREEGRVPAVVYGLGNDPVHVAVDGRDLDRELRKRHRVFQLEMEGRRQPVFLQDVQIDALTDEALHADFMRIDLDKPMPVEVELVFVGIPVGLSKGGELMRERSKLALMALPAAIPQEIEVKIANLDQGQSIHAKDLELPAGVSLNVSPETRLCHMTE